MKIKFNKKLKIKTISKIKYIPKQFSNINIMSFFVLTIFNLLF